MQTIYSSEAESAQCSLETYDLDQCPPYVALSYTWGNHRPSKTILVDGKFMPIGENLHAVLSILKQKDQAHHFSEDPSREAELFQHHFWIDAICVNQDDYNERGHQVNLMARIFSEAKCVIAWLGPRTHNSWLGIHFIRTGKHPNAPDDRYLNTWGLDDSKVRRKAEIWDEAYTAVIDLLSRPYWERMWVVQEFLLPSNLIILCGDTGAWWESMDRNFLSKSPTELALLWSGRSVVTDHTTTGWWNLNEARRRWQASTSLKTTNSQTLDSLLRQFHRGECRDVRDRVYALLSLVRSPAAATSVMLSADYNISARKLYHRVLSYLRHFSSLTNFVEWASFRLLLSQALEIPQDVEFQLHESVYEITDVLQDGKLLQLGVAEQVAAALAAQSSLRRDLGAENNDALFTTRASFARLKRFPGARPPMPADLLEKEEVKLRGASQTSLNHKRDVDFISTVRAMLEPDENWLHAG
ncbi:hypothetical protein N0V82_003842 [Gnomoniopsis sp. IMI 355080]|nr:hypothetical protein N0V82_003842 [Gnomoniopsis sp. IMI 355080]